MICEKMIKHMFFPRNNYFKRWAIVGVRKKVYCIGHWIYNTYELGRAKKMKLAPVKINSNTF